MHDARVYERGGRIVLEINGQHGEDAASYCTDELEARVSQRTRRAEIVIDIRELKGFSSEARRVWASRLEVLSGKRIASMTIIGGTPLARMAGAAIGLSSGIRILSAASLDEVFPDG